MSENTYAVAFSGKLVEAADGTKVRANLAQLFKLDATKVEHLFSGKRVVIKKGVDQQTAEKYKLALHKAGAVAEIINLAATSAEVQQPRPVTPPSVDTQQAVTPQAVTQESTGTAEPPVQGDMSSMTMAEPGVVLVAAEEVPDLQVDVSSMDMAEPGVVLVTAEEVPDLQVDVSGMDMAEPGVVLATAEEVPELDIDISSLSVDEPEPEKPKNPFM